MYAHVHLFIVYVDTLYALHFTVIRKSHCFPVHLSYYFNVVFYIILSMLFTLQLPPPIILREKKEYG